ncbi:putative odorant-binding protein A10 [Rhopalosiphum padi]|uniref:putative odorant-binding protein A10 n=1 Tax=Rhopalosiphum padi TaxID=40932 RepID=UPI00298DAEEA|nr:putative odorant-binding protein A10 [Rhopalosiphum padi]
MYSKLFISVLVITTMVGVSISVTEGDDAVKTVDKDDDPHPAIREEIKRYMSIMEKINIDQMLNNTRLMSNNVKCFLNEGPCTAHFREMKKIVPMLVKDSCSSCTKEQKIMMKKAIDAIKARRPNEYEQLSKLYDPEGKYEKKFLENLNESK